MHDEEPGGGCDPYAHRGDIERAEALHADRMDVVGRYEGEDGHEDGRRDIDPGRGLEHPHHDGHDVPCCGEADEVVVIRLLALVGVAEHCGDQDHDEQGAGDRLRPHRNPEVHEQRWNEGPREVVEPRNDLLDAGAAGEGAVNAVDHESDGEPHPHPADLVVDHGEHRQGREDQSRHGECVHGPGEQARHAGFGGRAGGRFRGDGDGFGGRGRYGRHDQPSQDVMGVCRR